jgi:hypothetical protein
MNRRAERSEPPARLRRHALIQASQRDRTTRGFLHRKRRINHLLFVTLNNPATSTIIK